MSENVSIGDVMVSVRTIVLCCVLPLSLSNLTNGEEPSPQKGNLETDVSYEAIRPCIGVGYQPYTYPAVGTCPCGDSPCFHPQRYYCGGKTYKKSWMKKWIGTQFGKRSMLDDYCCDCLVPTAVPRTYLKTIAVDSAVGSQVPPAPAAEGARE